MRVRQSCSQARYLPKKKLANCVSISLSTKCARDPPVAKPFFGQDFVCTLSILNCFTQSLLNLEPTSDSASRCSLQERQVVEPPPERALLLHTVHVPNRAAQG